jgi:uncharacterized SAM-binding protein YcdF (DUF218 family)
LKRKLRNWLLALAAMLASVILLHAPILGALGGFLVKAEPPQKADIVLVLAGDSFGLRILKAAELVRDGYAPKVLVSGPAGLYGNYECDLAIPFAVNHGFPESYFLHFRHSARSTQQEAAESVPELRRLRAKTVLLVTSDFHTRRAGKIFRLAAPDLTWYVVAAPDHDFSASGWWRSREGRKVFMFEWMKTVSEWFGV